MPTMELRDGASVEDTIAMLKKTLTWLMANLDHDNVKRLYTEYCSIRSQSGETQIDGPLLLMYDKQAVPVLRLLLGYNTALSKFVFEIYDPNGKKSVYLDENGTQVLDGQLLITYLTKTLLHAYKDTYGGVLKIYDVGGNLNAKIGVESGAGVNTGGTMILYDDVPSGGDPLNYQRVEAGILASNHAGIVNLNTNDTISRLRMKADDGTGGSDVVPSILFWGDLSSSYISSSGGYIAGETIATQPWCNLIFQPKISGASGSFTTADGKTVTVSNGIISSIV